MTKSWTLEVKENENGEAFIEFPQEVIEGTGWVEGDTIEWIDNKDGSWTLQKRELQWVMVETVQMFRHRYMVQVPVGTDDFGKDKADWALDTVTLEEAKEFSQKHLGETITSHRVVTMEEALKLCDEDNDYCKTWNDEKKVEAFFTKVDEHIRDGDY